MTKEETEAKLRELLAAALELRVGIKELRNDRELSVGARSTLTCALDAQAAAVSMLHMLLVQDTLPWQPQDPEGPCDAPEISTLEGEGHD